MQSVFVLCLQGLEECVNQRLSELLIKRGTGLVGKGEVAVFTVQLRDHLVCIYTRFTELPCKLLRNLNLNGMSVKEQLLRKIRGLRCWCRVRGSSALTPIRGCLASSTFGRVSVVYRCRPLVHRCRAGCRIGSRVLTRGCRRCSSTFRCSPSRVVSFSLHHCAPCLIISGAALLASAASCCSICASCWACIICWYS